MESILELTTIAVALLTFAIGVIVFLRDSKNPIYQSFFLVAVFFSLWMVANYYSNNLDFSHSQQLLINRLVFVFSVAGIGWLPIFFGELTGNSSARRYKKVIVAITVSLMLVSITPLVVKDIIPMEPVTEVLFGPMSAIYFLGLIFLVATSIGIFWCGVRYTKGIMRARLQVVGWATITTLLLGLVTNAVLPFVFGSFNATVLGPLFFSLMIAAFAYAIIHQRLFDVRLVIVRSLAYMLVVIVMGAFYVFFTTNVVSLIFEDATQTEKQILDAVVVVALIFAFQPLQRFFDHLTAQIFYREAYSIREVIDRLSDNLVTQIDIDRLCTSSLDILVPALLPSRMQIIALKKKEVVRSISAFEGKEISVDAELVQILMKQPRGIVHTEEATSRDLKKLQNKYGIDLALRLTTRETVEGFLLLGPKANGLAYNSKDLELLSISAKNLGLALSNAKQYQEISQFNETLVAKIELATKRLRRTNLRLKKSDSIKNDFISATSHQLKPKLAAAKGCVDLLYEEAEGPLNDNQRTTLKLISKSVDRMIHIVSDILGRAVQNPENFNPNIMVTDIQGLVKGEVNSQRNNATKRGITVEYELKEDVVELAIDQMMIQEVLSNLISNAVQYSHDNGVVKVLVAVIDNRMEFAVVDEGMGLGSLKQEDVFKKFVRGKEAKIARPTGTGLGLHIAKTLVEAHGGGIAIESRKKTGTKATFWLPLKF